MFNSLVHYASSFEYCSILNSNTKLYLNQTQYDWIVAFDAIDVCSPQSSCIQSFKAFSDQHQDWIFGHFGYDLKNEIERLSSENQVLDSFDPLTFFIPKWVFYCQDNKIICETSYAAELKDLLHSIDEFQSDFQNTQEPITLNPLLSRGEYLKKVEIIKNHIQRGDIYEANFCNAWTGIHSLDPLQTYFSLNNRSPAPFSAFYRIRNSYLMCSSPERFLRKKGRLLISEPIKGTIARDQDTFLDEIKKNKLKMSKKDRQENVMIVDLVRNDLSKSAKPGTVEVCDLFGIRSFAHVHHMVSTIQCEMEDKKHPVDAIKDAFPMGSMTGAPKVRALEIIEEMEVAKRGIFSGSIGYFDPHHDFDFNVVIRSICYDSATNKLSIQTGGAITSNSDPAQEYEESLLKARAMMETLNNSVNKPIMNN